MEAVGPRKKIIYLYAKPPIINVCCGTEHLSLKDFRIHVKTYHNDSVLSIQCNKCDRKADTVFKISSHYSKCNLGANNVDIHPVMNFPCEHCTRSFNTKTGLGVHMRRKHPQIVDGQLNIIRKHNQWSQDELRVMAIREAEWEE